jgi:hypothetical protein
MPDSPQQRRTLIGSFGKPVGEVIARPAIEPHPLAGLAGDAVYYRRLPITSCQINPPLASIDQVTSRHLR